MQYFGDKNLRNGVKTNALTFYNTNQDGKMQLLIIDFLEMQM